MLKRSFTLNLFNDFNLSGEEILKSTKFYIYGLMASSSYKSSVLKQATDESYVEDINGILNCGDLPNLYQLEDKASIMENMLRIAKQLVRDSKTNKQKSLKKIIQFY